MNPNNKVLVLPHICGIELVATNSPIPSIGTSLQPFYNTYVQNSTSKEAYVSPSKARYTESSKKVRAGLAHEQKLQLQFPSNDPLRVERIKEFIKIRYVYIKLSSGMVFYFGRNDLFQNSKPKIDITSSENITQITYTLQSIQPIGFTNGSFDFQLSEEFPANFYNL